MYLIRIPVGSQAWSWDFGMMWKAHVSLQLQYLQESDWDPLQGSKNQKDPVTPF